MNPAPVHEPRWTWSTRGRKLVQANFDRMADISADLMAAAQASRQRLANIPDDGADGGGTSAFH